MSTTTKQKHKAAPERPDVIKANDMDHLFLQTGSPIKKAVTPIKIRIAESIVQYLRRLILSPFF
jgi:hypothetical protein